MRIGAGRDSVNRPGPAQAASSVSGHGVSILFAGGGTGGHISPGLAIAEQLKEIAPDVGRFFACSTRAIDAAMLGDTGVRFGPVPARPFGVRPGTLLRFMHGWRRASREARRLLDRERVGAVVALGGFVAAPIVNVAAARKLPVLLLNLDAVPGKANRWMVRHCDPVLSAVATPAMPRFASEIVGMPIRSAALAPGDPPTCRATLGLQPDIPTLLVTGASLGAQSINSLLIEITRQAPEILDGWQVYHLTGAGQEPPVRASYDAAGVRAVVHPFQWNMGLAWGAADLVVSRAGANSVAEAWANAVPSFFLPYPFHRDHHQYANAAPMVEVGGAVVADDQVDPAATLAGVRPALETLLQDGEVRRQMHAALVARQPANAARDVAYRALMLLQSRQTA